MNAICLERTQIQLQRVMHLKGAVVMLFLALYRVFKIMESLFFERSGKTNVVGSPTSAKVFASNLVGNRTQDLPQGKRTL